MTEKDYKRIINIAVETGKIMLLNGAETYRVEETVSRMASSRGVESVNVFVIPTGILVSSNFNYETQTKLIRVSPSGINLEAIDHANAFSRNFSTTQMTLKEAENTLISFEEFPKFSSYIYYFFGAMAGGFFVLLFGGTLTEAVLSYFASLCTLFFWSTLSKKKLNFFLKNILGSFCGSLVGLIGVLLAQSIGANASFNQVLIGPLMTMVPGVSLTNGIRDLISGELLAGSAKIMEALFIAIALAFGVGMVIQIVLYLT